MVGYPLPENHGGQGDVKIGCAPASGETFPVGTTKVECSITDSLNRTASCSFSVIVGAPPRLRLTRFMAFGDSLTAGEIVIPGTEDAETHANPDTAYPGVLARLLSARYTTQTIVVTNRGKSGERSDLALGRFVDSFRADSPQAVILLEGVNDIIFSENAGLGIDTAEKGVSALAADARNRNARVFIVNLPPTKRGRRQVPLSSIQAFNDRLRVVARGEGARLIDIFSTLLPDVETMVGSDGLHLTEAGYKRVAETIDAAIRDDLEIK
jgi:lysophospholipase L1-like esterase